MKKINKIILTFISVFIIALALPYSVSAAPIEDDQVIFGDSYTLESGRILDGNLVMIGGVIDIQESAIVRGDIVTVGSVGNINGTIEGNLVAIGGTVTLAENALIQGNVYSPNSFINQEEGAVVQGETINEWQFPLPNIYTPSFNLPGINRGTGLRFLPGINRIVNKLATTLLIVALGSLMLLIMPKPAEVMVNALNASPWQVLGYGALTALVMLVSSVVFSITICLIPVVILLALAFGFAVLAGWLTLGYELGKRIAAPG